ncbi:MAG: class I SAM-dependent methyltransferase [Chitinophagaceae bacterium]|nr:class I SAM-dependent methyltransferase [Chitinophagaceae bacterium]
MMTAATYADQHSSALSPLLQQVLNDTMAQHPQAHMISGATQGLFLQMISRLMRPRYVLEIGTFTGFSALCLAEGLTQDGELHTIELRPEDAATARRYFSLHSKAAQLHLHVGPALDIIPNLPHQWDLVFIDADKTAYIDYYELAKKRLAPGGLIIADNVLFHGQVLEEPVKGKNAKAIAAFNAHVMADEAVQQVMLTVRDGLLLIQRKT